MPRPNRLDFRNANQYVLVSGREGDGIFFDAAILARFPHNVPANAPNVQRLEQLIAESCEECGTLLHAYTVEPNALTLVLRTAGAPLKTFMGRLCGQYSRYWRDREAGADGSSPFERRYESKVIATEYLPHAVRRTHLRPILVGLCRRLAEYPFSSARVYLGVPARVPLDLGAVKAVLERRGLFGIRGYREFMDQPETDFVARLFERGSELDSRIVGNKLFVMKARQMAARPWPAPTREELVGAAAKLIGTEPKELCALLSIS
jgi:REP element-mobilizing transposase RayT